MKLFKKSLEKNQVLHSIATDGPGVLILNWKAYKQVKDMLNLKDVSLLDFWYQNSTNMVVGNTSDGVTVLVSSTAESSTVLYINKRIATMAGDYKVYIPSDTLPVYSLNPNSTK